MSWKGETRTLKDKRQALCWGCGKIFGGASGFTKHQKGGECIDPAKVGLELKDGAWIGKVDSEAFTKHALAVDSKAV